jgi:hypothetical protein
LGRELKAIGRERRSLPLLHAADNVPDDLVEVLASLTGGWLQIYHRRHSSIQGAVHKLHVSGLALSSQQPACHAAAAGGRKIILDLA